MDIFYYKQSTQEMIIGAGEVITLKMFNIESLSSTSLFAGKTTIVKAVSLPPTSDAAAQHSLRCYHQIQCWLGHTVAATEYGYCVKTARRPLGSLLLPVTMKNPLAPDALLDYLNCGCKGAFNTKKSSCYNASKISIYERLSVSI